MSLSSSSKPLVHWYKLQDSKAHCSPHQQEEEIELLKRWRFPTCLLSVPMSFFSSSKGFPHIFDFLVLHSLLQWHRTCCPWNNQSKTPVFMHIWKNFPRFSLWVVFLCITQDFSFTFQAQFYQLHIQKSHWLLLQIFILFVSNLYIHITKPSSSLPETSK